MVADVVELAVGTEVNALKVVGQRHAGIETDAQSAVVGLLALGGYPNILVVPLVPLLVGYRGVVGDGVVVQLQHVR